MASFSPLKSTLVINVQTGLTTEGDPIVKARRYQNLKTTASADAVLTVGNAMAGLQKHTLAGMLVDQISQVA